MEVKPKIIEPGGLTKRLAGTIKAAAKSAGITSACEWLVSEGYATDKTHARELVESSLQYG